MNWAFPFIGAFSNWFIRGGGIESAFFKNQRSIPGLKILHAILYGASFALASGVWWHSVAAAGMMAVGQTPGWRDYISAMRGDNLNDHSVRWGIAMMTLRLGFWGACLAIGGVLVHSWLYAVLCLVMGLLGGIAYYLPVRFNLNYSPAFNDWTIGEQLFGFLLWLPLSFIC